ncbi:PTS lactose/cellobiose transporter subunit IIA [Clostridioides difficile]|uniref:PTS lactose/cellobiose transporter subunit IIA n=1 Tax=Clostridioides difficile TaxID=1496 RepID=UPI002114603A
MHKAHKFQTELIQNEANGNKTEISVILIHAQDHLMTAMNFQQLAEEFIDVYERLESK